MQNSQHGLLEGPVARRPEIVNPDASPEPDDLHRFDPAQEENAMLVLSRKRGERIVIGPNIEVTVVDICGNRVRLAFDAPSDVSVHRQEVFQRIQVENRHDAQRE